MSFSMMVRLRLSLPRRNDAGTGVTNAHPRPLVCVLPLHSGAWLAVFSVSVKPDWQSQVKDSTRTRLGERISRRKERQETAWGGSLCASSARALRLPLFSVYTLPQKALCLGGATPAPVFPRPIRAVNVG